MNTATTQSTCASATRVFEARLRDDHENHQFLFPCHDGPLAYHLVRAGNFIDRFKGVAACRCGALLGTLGGTIDGSQIILSRV